MEGLCHYLPLCFLHSMTGGKTELKISSHNDLRPLTCIWQSGFYLLFLHTKAHKKHVFFSGRDSEKKIFLSLTLSLQYLQTVSFGSNNCLTTPAFICFHCAQFICHTQMLFVFYLHITGRIKRMLIAAIRTIKLPLFLLVFISCVCFSQP